MIQIQAYRGFAGSAHHAFWLWSDVAAWLDTWLAYSELKMFVQRWEQDDRSERSSPVERLLRGTQSGGANGDAKQQVCAY